VKGDDQRHKEQIDAEELSSPSGTILYKAVLKEGVDELDRPSSALFWSGLAAGLSMGASLIAEALLARYLPKAPWTPLISKFGYSIGFRVVILGRQQLFRENTLTPMLPLLQDKTMARVAGVLRLWTIVLISNLGGCFAVAWACSSTTVFEQTVQAEFSSIGQAALEGVFWVHLSKGIFAGWLILMVWLPFAESARLWVIMILSYLIGLGHFSHNVAGAIQTFYMAVAGQAGWGTVLATYVAPTFIGNVIGGVALVAAIDHAQVVSGKPREAGAFHSADYSKATT